MGVADGPDALFVGDLDDPWVVEISDSLPESTVRLSVVGDLPEVWPAGAASARTLILHRPIFSIADVRRLRADKRAGLFPRLVLCVGPHVRYAQLEPWSELADAILPEATASETLARHLRTGLKRIGPVVQNRQAEIIVVGTNFELAEMLRSSSQEMGYATRYVPDWDDCPSGQITLWDVPVLEPDWPDILTVQSAERPIVALIGLAERAEVTLARSSGAAACLNLPCDPDDLGHVLDRLSRGHESRGDTQRARLDATFGRRAVRPTPTWPVPRDRPRI